MGNNAHEKKIYLITGNPHKFEEINALFKNHFLNYKLELKNAHPIEIQADDLVEVALFKLNSIKDKINDSCFVEDAGFFIDHPLQGFPGVYSSHVFKKIGNQGILKLIDDPSRSRARFKAVIALYFKPHDKVYVFEGEVLGKVAAKIRGSQGFGYDPIFIPNAMPHKTFGELTKEEKNNLSHRAMAIKKLIDFLKKNP
ncbi:MAG: XTP/dITP diphosphatase [Promethearchaeota archaeon]